MTLLDAGGAPIGAPAGQEAAGTPATVVLAPGEVASAVLHTTGAGIDPDCTAPSASMSVVPPDNTSAIVFPAVYTACGGFTVRSFVAGPTGL